MARLPAAPAQIGRETAWRLRPRRGRFPARPELRQLHAPTNRPSGARCTSASSAMMAEHAAPEFMAGLRLLGADAHRIPVLEEASERLQRLTGFEVIGVPGLIPEADFFAHLAERRFPVTVWMRRRDELDYLVEPDLFHDFFGHLPMLAHTVFANFIQAYGAIGAHAREPAALKMLARLYWYTVEFGLVAHLARPARLWRRHPVLERRDHLRHARHRARAHRLRSAARAAHQLPDRRLPEDLFRAGRHRAVVRQRARGRFRMPCSRRRTSRPTHPTRACPPTSRSLRSTS